MAFKDIRSFMNLLEKRGELVRVTAEVDAELEITEITDRISKQYGPALLFENVKGILNHDNGKTWHVIHDIFEELGYDVHFRVLNSRDYGIPQNRERQKEWRKEQKY